jgi:uncharacterized protein (TIGR00251 family)
MRLVPKSGGWALAVKVVPGSSRQGIAGAYGDGVKATVCAPAEDGAANEALIGLFAETLRIAPADVRIVRGHRSPRKELLIVGLAPEQIERRLLPGD